jgi:hypothetical protein
MTATPLASPRVGTHVPGPPSRSEGQLRLRPTQVTALGTVIATSDGTLAVDVRRSNLDTLRGSRVVLAATRTKVLRAGVRATLADIEPGDLVLVQAFASAGQADGHLTATRIHHLRPIKGGRAVPPAGRAGQPVG